MLVVLVGGVGYWMHAKEAAQQAALQARLAEIKLLKERLAPFERIESASAVGMSVINLEGGLQEAQLALDRLKGDSFRYVDGVKGPLTAALEEALKHYSATAAVWRLKIEGDATQYARDLYPIEKKIEAIMRENGLEFDAIGFQDCVGHMLALSSKDVANARRLIPADQ